MEEEERKGRCREGKKKGETKKGRGREVEEKERYTQGLAHCYCL